MIGTFIVDLIRRPGSHIRHRWREHRKAKRKTLMDGVNRQVKPLIKALGFQSARTEAWRGSEFREELRGWDHIRFRENHVELLSLRWNRHGGAYFIIDYLSGSLEGWQKRKVMAGDKFGRTRPGHFAIAWGLLSELWFGEGQSADRAVELALIRLRELDAYMKGGPMTRYIWDQHKDPAFATARTSDQTPDDQA